MDPDSNGSFVFESGSNKAKISDEKKSWRKNLHGLKI
jgi:hypothetical protein